MTRKTTTKDQLMDTLVHIALYRRPDGNYKLSVIEAFKGPLDEFETIKEKQEAVQEFAKKATWILPDEEN